MQAEFLAGLAGRARSLSRTVAFPDALDARTIRAASLLASGNIVAPVLVGNAGRIREIASAERIALDGIAVEDPDHSVHRGRIDAEFDAIAREREASGRARRNAGGAGGQPPPGPGDPLVFAGMMARLGLVHGSVAGSVSTTAAVIRAALRTVGLRPGVGRVSGYFLMIFPGRVMTFADCGVVPDPDAAGLAEIAGLAADNHGLLTGEAPVVAFLSFSTKGSAAHPSVEKVRSAAELFRKLRPEIASDGELQLDAAVAPEVARYKAPGSPAAGKANVLVFPDLDAGNIGYKIAQRLGGAAALGPILQGLAKPCFDLSRGCTAEDIVHVAAINAITSA